MLKKQKVLISGLLLIMEYMLIIPLLVVTITNIFIKDIGSNEANIIINLLAYFLTIGIEIYIHKNSLKKEWKEYKDNFLTYFKISFKCWGKAVLFMIISNMTLISILGNIAQNESANRSTIGAYPLFSILTMIILGPFIEELLFRKNFKKAFKNKEAYLLFTSFLFGLGHILISLDLSSIEAFINCLPQLLFIIPYGGMGYFFAKTYYETDNIFTSTTAHMIQNTLAVCLTLIGG